MGGGNFQINMGGPGGGGGPGGMMIMMGGPGGGGGGVQIMGGPGGGRFNVNKPHGTVFYSLGDSIFDARPYSLTGEPAVQPSYTDAQVIATL